MYVLQTKYMVSKYTNAHSILHCLLHLFKKESEVISLFFHYKIVLTSLITTILTGDIYIKVGFDELPSVMNNSVILQVNLKDSKKNIYEASFSLTTFPIVLLGKYILPWSLWTENCWDVQADTWSWHSVTLKRVRGRVSLSKETSD